MDLPPLSEPLNPTVPPDPRSEQAVATCDTSQITALVAAGTEIPTTTLVNDAPNTCAVLQLRTSRTRLLFAPVTKHNPPGTPAGLTGNDVISATSTLAQGQGYAIDITLTKDGVTAFNALAAGSSPQTSPRNEVAIVLAGTVYAAPQFQTSSFSGPVQITGNFTSTDASILATIVNLRT
jgi:preprotein translocase subunit SecD